MTRNMAIATRAAAGAPRRARPRCASPGARSRGWSFPRSRSKRGRRDRRREPTPAEWDALLDEARAAADSLGAVVECVATGVPAGWGAPVYAKLDADLAAAMMGINAVKGVEIGEGFAAARLKGSANADAMRAGAMFAANHAGIDGGISTGHRSWFASRSSRPRRIGVPSIDAAGNEVDAVTKGRHDPCVGIRGAPVVEAMMALVLADHKLLHRGQCG